MKSVLFLDDDPMVISSLKRLLHPLHTEFEIYFSVHIDNARMIIEQNQPDACFTDYNMPLINGVDFIKEMSPRSPRTSFYILSGGNDTVFSHIKEIKGVLQKPCQYADLLKVLKKI